MNSKGRWRRLLRCTKTRFKYFKLLGEFFKSQSVGWIILKTGQPFVCTQGFSDEPSIRGCANLRRLYIIRLSVQCMQVSNLTSDCNTWSVTSVQERMIKTNQSSIHHTKSKHLLKITTNNNVVLPHDYGLIGYKFKLRITPSINSKTSSIPAQRILWLIEPSKLFIAYSWRISSSNTIGHTESKWDHPSRPIENLCQTSFYGSSFDLRFRLESVNTIRLAG